MYSSIGDGFRKIHATEGLKGFTLVSTHLSLAHSIRLRKRLCGLPHPQRHSEARIDGCEDCLDSEF